MYIEYADINDNFEIILKYLFLIEYLLRSSKNQCFETSSLFIGEDYQLAILELSNDGFAVCIWNDVLRT